MKLLRSLLTLLIILAIGYSAAWFGGAWFVKNRFDQVVAEAAKRGVTLNADNVNARGFPLSFVVDLTNVKASRGSGLDWAAPETISAGINVTRPFTGFVEVSGVHQVISNGVPITANVEAETISASLNPFNRTLKGLQIDVPAVNLSSPGAGALQMTALKASLEPEMDSQVPFRLSIDQIDLPQPFAAVGNPGGIELNGHFFPKLPAGLNQQAVTKWQRENGLVTISSLKGRTEDLGWSGSGQLSISPELQPNANLTMRIKGMDLFMDKLVGLGIISRDRVGWAKVGLALFTRPAADGEGTEVVAPLVVRNGTVVLGPMELVKLPKINWPR